MANSHFIGDALLRQFGADSNFVEDWQLELEKLILARPPTKIVRVRVETRSIVYEGWRSSSIAEVLDSCAAVDGDLWMSKTSRFNSLGRSYQGYSKSNGSHYKWRQSNPEAAKANSRKQANAWRARAREEWHNYCAAYARKFPGQQPVGFDRWSKTGRTRWLDLGPDGIQYNDTKRLFTAEEARS